MLRIKRYLLFTVIALVAALMPGVALYPAAEAYVDAIPVDDAPCWEETPRVMVFPVNGGPSYCVGGEKRKFPNCP
jgi:hypothetical protein